MFVNEKLQQHLENSSSVRLNSQVIAEWNMNIPNNISQIGNYRNRPSDDSFIINNQFMSGDSSVSGATFYDLLIPNGFDNEDRPLFTVSNNEKTSDLFPLSSCFERNRPRSGINKAIYYKDRFTHFAYNEMASRPRYYMPSREDDFKYWTSFRKEYSTTSGEPEYVERGIANKLELSNNLIGLQESPYIYKIDDAAPFVVYKNPVPTNRIVVKMQTHVGSVDYGSIKTKSGQIDDPFFGLEYARTPKVWKIQYLVGDTWTDAASFREDSKRPDGSDIVGSDGYVELQYGPIVPEQYASIFVLLGNLGSIAQLPSPSGLANGSAYFIKNSVDTDGTFYICFNNQWREAKARYGWSLVNNYNDANAPYASELTEPIAITNPINAETYYTEFQYIQGLRIVVDAMNVRDSTLDLIELSPRLKVDLSSKTESYSVTKNASDLGVSGMPVSQLLASTGTLNLFDYDQAFSSVNTNSIIKDYLSQKIQFKFNEIIKDVDGEDISVPIKTLYSETFPETSAVDRSTVIDLRDLFYYFEQLTAPQVLAPAASLSYAISMLLDSIGFSNYKIYRLPDETEFDIPFFFIPPDTSVAQVLNDLATSAQCAMFFDEDNNFIVMSKRYMLPNSEERGIDMTLAGTKDFAAIGESENVTTTSQLANIENIASQDRAIYNDGTVAYTTRYIQRSYGQIKQANMLDNQKTWSYKPVLLWEVAPTESTKPINAEVSNQSSFVLGAIPLNSDLSDEVPVVRNGEIVNNIIDFGDGVYWITRYNGYFYANGEIIKYDAVEFSIPGLSENEEEDSDNVWITSTQDYSRYFAKLPFNGKMYPTGRVRVYVEPNIRVNEDGSYSLEEGAVVKHGRCQFGTGSADFVVTTNSSGDVEFETDTYGNRVRKPIYHNAGLSDYWKDDSNVKGCLMDFTYLSDKEVELPSVTNGPAGINNARAKDTKRTGKIKNFLATGYTTENGKLEANPATVQSSAFVFNGTSFASSENPLEHISYVHKSLDRRFTHHGTRMRIIGKQENSEIRGQSPIGAFTYYTPAQTTSDQPSAIAGASGGIAVGVNPDTNAGYYFEIIALTDSNLSQYTDTSVNNMLFYKIQKEEGSDDSAKAVPIPLWDGIGQILVDDGRFTGQARMANTEVSTVYDLAVEYQDIGSTRRFYLYVNNTMIAIVDDDSPLPTYNNVALFVRGSSECMFENIYALAEQEVKVYEENQAKPTVYKPSNYAENKKATLFSTEKSGTSSKAFGVGEISAADAFNKYAISGFVQNEFLSGVDTREGSNRTHIYYEEFGTIMREAHYFNIRYDKAYPALYAKLSPTFNRVKGYATSNFFATSYGAEFLVFNATDSAVTLDSTSGNYLRIQGVTFTQESVDELTVDKYFDVATSYSKLNLKNTEDLLPQGLERQRYLEISQSRLEHGKNAFSLNAPYIQSQDAAEELMNWMIDKTMKPSRSVGLEIFGTPTLQLGDIVKINFVNNEGVSEIAPADTSFVVYSIEYTRDPEGPTMIVYVSEVV